jgi:hypothetical protein
MEVRFSSPVRLVRAKDFQRNHPQYLDTPDGGQVLQPRQAGQGAVISDIKIIPDGSQVL